MAAEVKPKTSNHKRITVNNYFKNPERKHVPGSSTEERREVFTRLTTNKDNSVVKDKNKHLNFYQICKAKFKYSVDFSSKLPNLLNHKVDDNVRHSMIGLSRANVYGVQLKHVPFLEKKLDKCVKNLKSKKLFNIRKMMGVLKKYNKNNCLDGAYTTTNTAPHCGSFSLKT